MPHIQVQVQEHLFIVGHVILPKLCPVEMDLLANQTAQDLVFEALNLLRTLLRRERSVVESEGGRGGWVGWLSEDFIGFYTSFFKGLNGPREKRARGSEGGSGTANVHCNQMSSSTRILVHFLF